VTAHVRETITRMLHALQDAYPPVPEAEQHLVPVRLGGTAPTPEEAAVLEAQLRAKGVQG